MFRLAVRIAVLVLMGTFVAGMIGCGSDIREDPWLNDKLKTMENDIGKLKRLSADVVDLREEVDVLTDEITRLKSSGGKGRPALSPAQLNALNTRLAKIENRLGVLETTVKTLSKKTAAASRRPPVSLRTKPSPKPAPGAKKPPAHPSTAAASKPAPKPAKPAAKAEIKPKGHYYKAVAGDNVAKVAKKFGISVEAFIKANPFVRADSPLVEGQLYWIPQK